jgi:hypothetical protein
MRIKLEVPQFIKLFCTKAEPIEWGIWRTLLCLWFLEAVAGTFIWRWRTVGDWSGLLIAMIFISILFFYLRRHRFMSWKVNQLANEFREPRVVDLKRLAVDTLLFRRFSSVVVLLLLAILVIYPYPGRSHALSYFRTHLSAAKYDLYLAIWEVHATLVGFFVVFLTFVFQLVSVRLAYETSVLRFLTRRERFGLITCINFAFLLIDSIGLLGDDRKSPSVLFRYLSVVGFVFAIFSALFIFYRVLELLRPDTVESGLSTLIQAELMVRLDEEQNRALAEYLLIEECRVLNLEYSPFDAQIRLPALRASKQGTIKDLDIDELKRFAASLGGEIQRAHEVAPKALLLKTVGDEINSASDAMARVSEIDATEENAVRLNRCFRIVEL